MKGLHASSRRDVLLASGMLFAWPHLPKLAHAEGRDPRFLTIVLRGALDGLAAVAPIGDPDWTALRGDNALTLEGKTPALKLDDFFALNPAMPNLHHLFQGREAIIVHAAATPYRALDAILYDDFSQLRAARRAEDERISRYVSSLNEADLAGTIRYRTVSKPTNIEQPLAPALDHQALYAANIL